MGIIGILLIFAVQAILFVFIGSLVISVIAAIARLVLGFFVALFQIGVGIAAFLVAMFVRRLIMQCVLILLICILFSSCD